MSIRQVDKTTGDTDRIIAGGTLYASNPIGTILPFGGEQIPTGWHICDGSEVSKTTYAELYAVIGDAFGTASVNTNFCLPDLREATTKGCGLTSKSNNHYDADGISRGEFVEDRIQEHTHSIDYNSPASGTPGNGVVYDETTLKTNISTNSGRSGATTEVKAVGVNYIILMKEVALPAQFMSKVDEAVEEVFDSGLTQLSAIQPNTKSEQTILFNKTFSTPPIVICNLYGTYFADELLLSAVLDVTTTDFKVRISNIHNTSLEPEISWMAKG